MSKSLPNRLKLTDTFVKKSKPQTRAFLVWDTLQRGLVLRVEPTGFKSWKVIYRHHGRPRWYNLGNVDAIGLADARKLAGRTMYSVAEGRDPQAERRAARNSGTFEDLATRYSAYAEGRNKSWRQATALVQRHLIPSWGKLRAADIARSDVRAMMARIKAPIVANQTLAAASAIFTWAIREEIGGIKVNPCHGVERNPTLSRERVLSDSEVPLFWSEFDAAGLQGMALKLILLCGQRPGEVAHMRTEHIEGGWWSLPGAPAPAHGWPGTKNAQTHRVWLAAAAKKIVAELDPLGFVFGGPRGGPPYGLAATMRAICDKLGVERATPHDLRRTFSTKVTGLGFGRDALNRVTNHREGGIVSVYDRHGYGEENQRIMEAVASKILSLTEGKPGGDSNVVAAQFGKKHM
jgi:integrase